jgi:hypothetical protein
MGHGIIPDHAGSNLFAGLIFVFLLATLGFAPPLIQLFDNALEEFDAMQARREKEGDNEDNKKGAQTNHVIQDLSSTEGSASLEKRSFITDFKEGTKRMIRSKKRRLDQREALDTLPTSRVGNGFSASGGVGYPSIEVSQV